MPELIAFYEDHTAHRDKFEIFAIHDDGVKSFDELDKKLAGIKKKYWRGKDLPFPILLDGKGKTHKRYGIRGWPTGLLINPAGELVGEASVAALEAKLPPLPPEKKWARHRDMQKNVFWSFEPKENTLSELAKTLKRWSGCEVGIDHDAIQVCGLTTDGPLPGVLIGSRITLRSIDELLLAPHGLGLAPSTEKEMLLITKRPPTKEAPSYSQKLRAKELAERLDGEAPANEGKEAKSLEIKDQPLLDTMKLIRREYDLPVALDARAMHIGKLDPTARVSGDIAPDQLRKSLVKLLAPLGLTVEVRHEAIVVTPTNK